MALLVGTYSVAYQLLFFFVFFVVFFGLFVFFVVFFLVQSKYTSYWVVSFPDPEHTVATKGSGDTTTCYLTFEGRDHDDILNKFQAKLIREGGSMHSSLRSTGLCLPGLLCRH